MSKLPVRPAASSTSFIKSRKHASHAPALAMLATLALPMAAHADDADQPVPTVTITGTQGTPRPVSNNSKFTAPLLDTPKAVTVITSEVIAQTGATSMAGSLSDGILVANNGDLRIDELLAIQAGGTPVVVAVWEFPDAPPPIPCVAFDSRMAGRIATEHLLALGHRRIGAIIASEKGGIHNGRYDGYREALQQAQLRPVQANVRFCSDAYQSGYDAALALLGQRPNLSALFVSNDLPALGVLNAVAALGLRVPEDISVVSITDIELAGQTRPALTTVAHRAPARSVSAADRCPAQPFRPTESPPWSAPGGSGRPARYR